MIQSPPLLAFKTQQEEALNGIDLMLTLLSAESWTIDLLGSLPTWVVLWPGQSAVAENSKQRGQIVKEVYNENLTLL